MLTFKIENETDLHVKVVHFLKKRYPHSLFTVTLGENQHTSTMRIASYKKGYLCGSPDLIINNLHKYYTGFAIELKNPRGYGVLSPDQSMTGLPLAWKTWKSQGIYLKSQGICDRIAKVREKSGNFVV